MKTLLLILLLLICDPPISSDVNSDGIVDVSDWALIWNIMTNNFYQAQCDLDCNSRIDVEDLIICYNDRTL